MQQSYVLVDDKSHLIELPNPEEEVLPGVPWGRVEAIGSPAQWVYLVEARKLEGGIIKSRLGDSLKEEVAACLLGGHGIPAQVGVAAFEMLKAKGAFASKSITQDKLLEWLSNPLMINGREVKYRFANQKSKYLYHALHILDTQSPPLTSGRALRDWLLQIKGVGLKTASWVARNWLNANDVAILDIHILRAGILSGFYSPGLNVEKDYLELEAKFLEFSEAINIPASELDAEIWWQFSQAATVVHRLFSEDVPMPGRKLSKNRRRTRTNHRHSSPDQRSLFA